MNVKRPRVLYLSHAGEDVYALVREAAGDRFEVVTLERDDDVERCARIADCEAVICAASKLRKLHLDAAKTLRVVHHQGVGWQDTTDWQEIQRRGLPMALTPEGTTTGVAEHTILLMLAAAKRLTFADRELRAGRWHVNSLRAVSRELYGKAIGYVGAGTIEFLLSETGEFYFMEMNTRIQVEHPVTELVTGQDLVLRQLTIAQDEPLDIRQDQVRFRGHAIECRINAEDPERNFLPTPGRIETFHQPGGPGVRVDTAAYQSYVIPPHYDSLVAKVLTHGTDRAQAIARMRVALDEFVVEGIATTIPLHRRLIQEPRFLSGDVHTRFVEDWLAAETSIPVAV